MSQKIRQPIHQHLAEARERITFCVIVFLIAVAVGFYYNESLQYILVSPLGQKIYYTSPAGGFTFALQIAIYFGAVISFPFIIYNLLRFLHPVMNRVTYKQLILTTAISTLLVVLGVLFAYFISLPAALGFLQNFSNQSIDSLITTKDYLSFLGVYILGFILIFQIPIFLYTTHKINALSARMLIGHIRLVIVVSVIVAAIITPTSDPLNLIIMAAPMIFLYLISVLFIWLLNTKEKSHKTPLQ